MNSKFKYKIDGSKYMNNYEVIKQIGSGSFSNVYLCKQDIPLFINEAQCHDDLFIIKEININDLVRSYIRSSKMKRSFVKRTNKRTNENIEVNITPYDTKNLLDDAERTYYYRRLQELIESEIEILKRLSHDNIIKFYGYTKSNDIYYLHMEYCDGGDVYDYLKNGKENKSRNSFGGYTNMFLYDFCKQVIGGLKYIHTKNIIHRDIKLHNILIKSVVEDGIEKICFKISDFGFACYDLSCLDKGNFRISEMMRKKYYKLCGTPYYMAPEIILNMNCMENITFYNTNEEQRVEALPLFVYNKGIDIWSFGVCVYELMFNILPFSKIKTINDLEDFYNLEDIQDIMGTKINNKKCLTIEFKRILLRMLNVNKDQRVTISDLDIFFKNYQKIEDLINTENSILNIDDIINCKENMFLKNEDMKQHIVKIPVGTGRESKIESIENDWCKVNNSNSMETLKTNIPERFFNWLFKKK